jgi:hypothetical protein
MAEHPGAKIYLEEGWQMKNKNIFVTTCEVTKPFSFYKYI